MVNYRKFDSLVDSDDELPEDKAPGTQAAFADMLEKKLLQKVASVSNPSTAPVKETREVEVVVPEGLLCPMLHSVIRDPVVNAAGNTYERGALYKFWETSDGEPRDPLTNALLLDANTIPNWDMRRRVQGFLDLNPDYVPDGWASRAVSSAPVAEVWPGAAERWSKCTAARKVQDAPLEARLVFVRKIYGMLILQVVLVTLIAKFMFLDGDPEALKQAYTLNAALLCLMMLQFSDGSFLSAARSSPKNIVMALLFVQQQAAVTGFVGGTLGWENIMHASSTLLLMLAALIIYTYIAGADYIDGRQPYSLCVFCTLLSNVCALLCGSEVSGKCLVMNCLGVELFAFWIIYDTQRILRQSGGHSIDFIMNEYLFGALVLYYDFAEMFVSAFHHHCLSQEFWHKPIYLSGKPLTQDEEDEDRNARVRGIVDKLAEMKAAEERARQKKAGL